MGAQHEKNKELLYKVYDKLERLKSLTTEVNELIAKHELFFQNYDKVFQMKQEPYHPKYNPFGYKEGEEKPKKVKWTAEDAEKPFDPKNNPFKTKGNDWDIDTRDFFPNLGKSVSPDNGYTIKADDDDPYLQDIIKAYKEGKYIVISESLEE